MVFRSWCMLADINSLGLRAKGEGLIKAKAIHLKPFASCRKF
jgi:hypothetical protein